jgi:multiphosphoryl transfer protein
MAQDYRFNCPLPNGLHARPASCLADAAARFKSHATLVNGRTGAVAGLESVLDLVAAGILDGDPCVLCVSGPDEAEALAALARFIEHELLGCDTVLPVSEPGAAARLPRPLAQLSAGCYAGLPASPGLGLGRVVHLDGSTLPGIDTLPSAGEPSHELALFKRAQGVVLAQLEEQAEHANGAMAAEVAKALLALARDPALSAEVERLIQGGGQSASAAVVAAIRQYSAKLQAAGSAYLRERVPDLEDIGLRLLAELPGGAGAAEPMAFAVPSVLCARSLPASQLLSLDRELLAGIVLSEAGTTSHAVILARSFGVPCVAGISDLAALRGVDEAVVDGSRGLVLAPVTPAVRRFVEREENVLARKRHGELAAASVPAQTRDGVRIEVAANIAAAAEAATALVQGAEGVGLFRTEMLFAAGVQPPGENEQYDIYRTATLALAGRPLIIRTLDIGGDKPVPYLNLPREDNPFLGYRGIRMYEGYPDMITSQLRAIVRASAHGPVRVMAPMVATVAEARWLREHVAAVQAGLAAEGIAFDPAMPVGVMVEVPSAALLIPQLSGVVDFFSVGTNDLTQYLLAVDRGNTQVAGLYQELHPAVLRALHIIATEARAAGKWAGICGELARTPLHAPLLAGLGFTELSMSAPAIPAVKAALARHTLAECEELAHSALACAEADDVAALLAEFARPAAGQPLTGLALIEQSSDSADKAEAIRELCGLCYLAGRCADIDALEAAVWAREETYSTGLGYGFAIPHCKSGSIDCGTLALLKLREPIEWGSLDGRPVRVVILLAMPAADTENTHLKVFAKLARKLMHEEFRDGLLGAESAAAILARLTSELELNLEEGSHGT